MGQAATTQADGEAGAGAGTITRKPRGPGRGPEAAHEDLRNLGEAALIRHENPAPEDVRRERMAAERVAELEARKRAARKRLTDAKNGILRIREDRRQAMKTAADEEMKLQREMRAAQKELDEAEELLNPKPPRGKPSTIADQVEDEQETEGTS